MSSSQLPGFITRQSIVVVVLFIALLFFILALALPWYKITETNVPYPTWDGNTTATVVSTFYWTGVTLTINSTNAAVISPSPSAAPSAAPSTDPSPSPSPQASNSSAVAAAAVATSSTTSSTTTTRKMPWSDFPTDAVEAKLLTSLALLVAAVGLDLVLLGPVLFARTFLNRRFGHKATKWALLCVSLAMIICAFLAWFLFFGLCESFALDESFCPDEAYLGLSVFDEEKYWCTTFIGDRSNIGRFHTDFKWGPLSGWWMALVGAIVSVVASFCLFLLKPPAVEELGHKRPLLHDNDYVSYH